MTRSTGPTELLLASASPRRQQLLKAMGARVRVVSHGDAKERTGGLPPAELACENARIKGEAARKHLLERRRLNQILLAVDTIVVLDGTVLGKPKDEDQARRMLASLAGRTHTVISGLYAVDLGNGKAVLEPSQTRVTMRRLSRQEIWWYVATGEGLDKAGSYGIQCLGGLLVKRVEGCYFNVVGLPLVTLQKALSELGYSVPGLLAPNSRGGAAWRAAQRR